MIFDLDITPSRRYQGGHGFVTGFLGDMPINASAFFSDQLAPDDERYRSNLRNFQILLYAAAKRRGIKIQTQRDTVNGISGIRVWRIA